jgi:hypothetical protein
MHISSLHNVGQVGKSRRALRRVLEDLMMTDPDRDPVEDVASEEDAQTEAEKRELAAEEVAAKLGDVA